MHISHLTLDILHRLIPTVSGTPMPIHHTWAGLIHHHGEMKGLPGDVLAIESADMLLAMSNLPKCLLSLLRLGFQRSLLARLSATTAASAAASPDASRRLQDPLHPRRMPRRTLGRQPGRRSATTIWTLWQKGMWN